jgi:Outer membrane protein beta-barrel domain
MKRTIFLIVFCCIASLLTAQRNRYDSRITIGTEGGLGRFNVNVDSFFRGKTLWRTRLQGGIFVQYRFSERYSLRTGLLYEHKGTSVKSPSVTFPPLMATYNFNLYYCVLPILMRATFGEEKQFFVNGGPYIGYLLHYTQFEDNAIGEGPKYNVSHKAHRIDAGISLGIGGHIMLTKAFLMSLELRHNLGLLNVMKKEYYAEQAIKNRSTQLLLGLGWRIKEKKYWE